MNEKLQITKDSIEQIFATDTFKTYQSLKTEISNDSKYQMYLFVLNNRDKFSAGVVSSAKLKLVNKEQPLRPYRKQIDQALNQILSQY